MVAEASPSPQRKLSHALPLFSVLKEYKKSLFFTGAVAAFTGIYFYIGNIYMVTFLHKELNLPLHVATGNALLGEIITMVLIPCMAYWADKRSPYQHYRLSLLAAAIACPCLFLLVISCNLWLVALGMLLFGITNAAICGPMVKLVYDQFPMHLRYTGISFGWSLSAAVFSGSAPMIAQFLCHQQQWLMGPSLYVSMMAIFTYFITQKCLNTGLVVLKPSLQRI